MKNLKISQIKYDLEFSRSSLNKGIKILKILLIAKRKHKSLRGLLL